MKKLFFFSLALFYYVFAYAGNGVVSNPWNDRFLTNESDRETGYIIYHELVIFESDIVIPYVVQIPAPPTGTVVQVNGPARPNIPNWSVNNGILTITYTEENEVADIREKGVFYIETRVTPAPEPFTPPFRNYAVRVIVL